MTTTQVTFNAPICITIDAPKPATPEPPAPVKFSHMDIQKLVTRYREEGWDERTIVTRAASTYTVDRTNPVNWGVIVDVSRHQSPLMDRYMPFKVRWVKDGSVTSHWPEDLMQIHKALSVWEVNQVFKGQE